MSSTGLLTILVLCVASRVPLHLLIEPPNLADDRLFRLPARAGSDRLLARALAPDRQRLNANFSFFATNYLMICATCSAVYILRSPGLLLTLLVSMCMFFYVFMSRRKTLVVLDVTLGTREKTIAAAAGARYCCVAVHLCFDIMILLR